METNRCFNFINRYSRLISICVGLLTMGSWAFYSCQMGRRLYHTSSIEHDSDEVSRDWEYLLNAIPPLISYELASVVASALMVYGAIRRTANYIVPWLVLHFVRIIDCITTAFLYTTFVMFAEFKDVTEKQDVMLPMIVTTSVSVLLIPSLGVVYLYWKSLLFPRQKEPTVPEGGQLLKTRNLTEEQID